MKVTHCTFTVCIQPFITVSYRSRITMSGNRLRPTRFYTVVWLRTKRIIPFVLLLCVSTFNYSYYQIFRNDEYLHNMHAYGILVVKIMQRYIVKKQILTLRMLNLTQIFAKIYVRTKSAMKISLWRFITFIVSWFVNSVWTLKISAQWDRFFYGDNNYWVIAENSDAIQSRYILWKHNNGSYHVHQAPHLWPMCSCSTGA